jgi:perosamine synthetase
MQSIRELCIDKNESLLDAMKLLDKNAQGILFVTDMSILCGTLSDGDIRRALMKGASRNERINDHRCIEFVSLPYETPVNIIQQHLSQKIKAIPLIDKVGHIIDYASALKPHRFSVMEPLLGGNELAYVTDCIKTNWISSQGKYVHRFEQELKTINNGNYCLATSNGTVALHLALIALGVSEGDEVIVPNFTFGASINAIMHAGATPVLVDIDEDTWNVSIDEIEAAISPKTKAIMPVHIYGNPCDMVAIMAIAKTHDLLVIEDCAEALGATINGKPVGSFGDAAAFSFFANKVITCGEGGAIILKNEGSFKKALLLRDHGMSAKKRYWHEEIGYNYRLTNLQAAIGCAQLEQLSYFNQRRAEIFSLYDELLLDKGLFEAQKVNSGNRSSYWLYTVCLVTNAAISRDQLVKKLLLKGIETRPTFHPMHEMPAFINAKVAKDVSTSIAISSRGISLPSAVTLKNEEIIYICNHVLSILED